MSRTHSFLQLQYSVERENERYNRVSHYRLPAIQGGPHEDFLIAVIFLNKYIQMLKFGFFSLDNQLDYTKYIIYIKKNIFQLIYMDERIFENGITSYDIIYIYISQNDSDFQYIFYYFIYEKLTKTLNGIITNLINIFIFSINYDQAQGLIALKNIQICTKK